MVYTQTHKKTQKHKNTKTQKHKNTKTYEIPEIDKDIQAIIDVGAIKHNINFLKQQSGTDLMVVLKSNAYGHGIVEISKLIRKMDIKYIGVATVGEAILLRKNGDNGRILAWLYNINGNELIDAFHMDIDIAIYDETTIDQFIDLIPLNKKIKITVFVDTGMNRTGVSYDNAIELFKIVNKCPKIEIIGMMSHLVCSHIKNSPIVNEQLYKFRKLRQELFDIGINPPLVHIADTCACINYDVSDFTLARPGIGCFGIFGSNTKIYEKGLKLAMSLKTRIIQIKSLEKNKGIGYDWKYITPHKMKICILPIGYADILSRNTSCPLTVYINGTKRKILGLLNMDQVVVEAKKIDKLNDEVYLFGNGQNCSQTIYDIARISNTIPAEILSHTGYRIAREYKN